MAHSEKCFTCGKGAGVAYCRGCSALFCWNDLKKHKEELCSRMDELIQKRDELQDLMNRTNEESDLLTHILVQINEWETVTMEKVREVANRARCQAENTINRRRVELSLGFKDFTMELVQIKENEDFSEPDMARLEEMLNNFHQTLKLINQPSAIIFHKEQADQMQWNTLVSIEENLEKSQFAAPGTYKERDCHGRHCASCGKCRDWYYNDNDLATWNWIRSLKKWGNNEYQHWNNCKYWQRFTKRHGATCLHYFDGDYDHYDGVHDHGYGHYLLCMCEDNIRP